MRENAVLIGAQPSNFSLKCFKIIIQVHAVKGLDDVIKMASRHKENVLNRGDEVEDLLVFGYSCKLFRDDEKALYIDQGKHLIPWMGDETLKIDRYDARGTLFDLKEVEAPSGGFDRFFGLTDIEKQVETMCDEERYRALLTNEEEETLYQEEELKRLHLALGDRGKEYGQVEYKYDGNSNEMEPVPVVEPVEKTVDGADDEPFVPSPQLDLPVDMILPETVKHNAIIEKTALFINSQGPQMEILLKMKQAGNPLFNFLSFDNPLHNYYRYLLMAIKGGRYKPDMEKSMEKKGALSDSEVEEDDNYLHPSLASSVSKVELAPSIPSINYKPSAHCAYSMLVNKIKDKKAKGDALPNLIKLKQALQRLNSEKKEEITSGNDSDSNCSSESKSSVKSKSSSHSTLSLNSFKNSQSLDRRPIETPPNDVQVIIDKMASYVAKNGRDFEAIVQMKKDPRFDFLNSTHIYYPYYQNKVKQYENLEKPEEVNKSGNGGGKGKEEQTKAKVTPVCFSIKKAKESESVIEKSALPVEESSDEEGKEEEKKENVIVEEKEKEVKEEIVTVDLAAAEDKEEKNKKILAAERIKDKLTAAVREKVAIASKEKQLQLERKRRAIAFLKNLQVETGSLNISGTQGPQLPDRQIMGRITDDDSDVASLPDEIDELVEERKNSVKSDGRLKRDQDGGDKRRKTYNSVVRHKSSGKHRDKLEKSGVNERKTDEVPDRTTDSSFSSDENERRKSNSVDDSKKFGKRRITEDSYFSSKTDRVNISHSEEKRHRRRKHRKEDGRDRNSRKHCKSKKQKRSRESDSERRSKRSRRCSGSSSDP